MDSQKIEDMFSEDEQIEIKNILNTKKFSDIVLEKGIVYLINEWTWFVDYCNDGFEDNFDEYTNDLTTREIIQYVIDSLDNKNLVLKIKKLISNADTEFKNLLVNTEIKSWPIESDDKEKYFWFWGIVKNAKGELLEDIKKLGKYEYYNKK